jgi:hypothetical protein
MRAGTILALCLMLSAHPALIPAGIAQQVQLDLPGIESRRVITAAKKFLSDKPITITSYSSPRSAGGPNEYFSEGDYWWPDPKNPGGPYIQRDGMTNPDNFNAHRLALIRLSVQVPTLVSAYKLTGEQKYAAHAARHLRAWFLDEQTRLLPHLKYAQAIHGRVTGRGVGIIDTLHLVEVAKSMGVLKQQQTLSEAELQGIREWFRQYLDWMTTHPYGIEERDAKNNHATCWILQVAAFADLVGDQEKLGFCRSRFKEVLLPDQMAGDGSFPLELRRTKPYGYSLFNLEVMAAICQLLSSPKDDLWEFRLPDGRGMRKALDFLYPYIADKSRWPHPPDVMFFEHWPVRQSCLLFAGLAFRETRYLDLWKKLDPDPTNEEVIRNYPVRQPLLWLR